jgi:competence protein ComFC
MMMGFQEKIMDLKTDFRQKLPAFFKWKEIKAAFLDYLYPPLHPCPGCGKEDTLISFDHIGLCENCHEAFPWILPGSLPPDVIVPSLYEGSARALVFHLKYREGQYLATVMAKAMADTFCENGRLAGDTDWTIIPVPLHRKREKERGYNQSHLLAKHVASLLSVPYEPQALFRNRPTTPMYRLNRLERVLNTADSMSLNPDAIPKLKGRQILLVDDIYTTGATANACIQTLLKADVAHVSVLAFAQADLEDHSR